MDQILASNRFEQVSKVGPKSSSIYAWASHLDRLGIGILRLSLVIVLLWIGGLKFVDYEADSIVPLVANSPMLHFFYNHPAPEYRRFMNKEGEFNPDHRRWHESNGTYRFSYGLGCVIVLIGLLILFIQSAHRPQLLAACCWFLWR